ncbi:MAG: hypothetical protein ACK4E8_12180 [Lacibacter sp.]
MAINKNHEFEELNGIKCAIVERNVSAQRAAFLKNLLEYNKFEVVVAPAAPPKTAAPAAEGEAAAPQPELYTVGVTHLAFNPINAIFGRLLRTPDGHVVTQAYWLQKEAVSRDDIPYYEKTL